MIRVVWLLAFFWLLAPVSRLSASPVFDLDVSSLPALLGKDSAKLRLYAADSNGVLTPIPIQVDGASAATLTAKDSILWMASDMGPRVDPAKWPAAVLRYEIAADSSGDRVAYLAWEDSPSPPAKRVGVRYDAARDQVESDFYRIGFTPGKPLIQDLLVLKNALQPQDILDRFKVRLKLAIRNFFDFSVNEEDISSRIGSVRAGPIRVARTVYAFKKIGPIKLIPKSRMDFFFYPDWIEVRTQVVNPVDGPKILDAKTAGVSGFDLLGIVRGSAFYSDLGGPLAIDGKPNLAKSELSRKKLRWWSLTGPSGSLVIQVTNDPNLSRIGVEPSFVFADDVAKASPPEGEKGGVFLGFDLPYHRIPKGEYQVRVLQVFPKSFLPGQEEALLKEARIMKPSLVRPLP
jgi:hypothetical protein